MQQFVKSFSEFVTESKVTEMRRHHYHSPYRSRYRSSDNPYIEPKDRMRARELKNGRAGQVDSDPNGGSITISNAKKMAKLITDTGKLMARMEAIRAEYPNNDAVIRPFVDRVLELLPNSKYAAAYNVGIKDGKFSATIGTDSYNSDAEDVDTLMSVFADLGLAPPPVNAPTASGNQSEQIMYQVGFDLGVEQKEAEMAALPSAEQVA